MVLQHGLDGGLDLVGAGDVAAVTGCSPSDASRSNATGVTPRAASSPTSAEPIPRAPPVTTTTLGRRDSADMLTHAGDGGSDDVGSRG